MAYGTIDLPPLLFDDDGAGNKIATTKLIDGLAGDTTPLAFVMSSSVATLPISIFDNAGNQISSFAGPTEYDEGDTDATITGQVPLWEDASDTLRPISVSKPLPVQLIATTSGGHSFASYTNQGNTKQAVKASAGKLTGWYIYNPNASAVYVQVFDAASGSVTLGSTSPSLVLAIPAGGAANIPPCDGLTFATAITIAVTTTETGSTGPATGCTVNFWYK